MFSISIQPHHLWETLLSIPVIFVPVRGKPGELSVLLGYPEMILFSVWSRSAGRLDKEISTRHWIRSDQHR